MTPQKELLWSLRVGLRLEDFTGFGLGVRVGLGGLGGLRLRVRLGPIGIRGLGLEASGRLRIDMPLVPCKKHPQNPKSQTPRFLSSPSMTRVPFSLYNVTLLLRRPQNKRAKGYYLDPDLNAGIRAYERGASLSS